MDRCEACETKGVGLAFVADVASSGPQEPQPCAFPNQVAGLGQCANAPRCDPTPAAPGRSCLAYSRCVRTLLWYLKSHAPEVPISCKLRGLLKHSYVVCSSHMSSSTLERGPAGFAGSPCCMCRLQNGGNLLPVCALRVAPGHLLPPRRLRTQLRVTLPATAAAHQALDYQITMPGGNNQSKKRRTRPNGPRPTRTGAASLCWCVVVFPTTQFGRVP